MERMEGSLPKYGKARGGGGGPDVELEAGSFYNSSWVGHQPEETGNSLNERVGLEMLTQNQRGQRVRVLTLHT